MKNNILLYTISLLFVLCGCNATQDDFFVDESITANSTMPIKIDRSQIKTLRGANDLDLETPLRCNVNWNTQEMVLSLPYNNSAFKLERNDNNDPLPRFEVSNFEFNNLPAEQALLKLLKEADIKLSAKDAPYATISGSDLNGDLPGIVKMIAEAGEFYFNYNANRNVVNLSRRANFTLYTPESRPLILSVLDVLRGSGITNITTDWSEYSVTFDADFELEKKIRNLISTFENSPVLIAYDVSVFKIYPHNDCGEIEWKNMLKEFDFGTITTAKTSVIGRILTTTDELNIHTLQKFLGNQADVVKVSEGKFVVPSDWSARFDVSKCTELNTEGLNLSILAKAVMLKGDKISSDVTLETEQGQVSHFNVRSKLGDNYVIIGIPNTIFGETSEISETVIFMVPRIIRSLKTDETIKNKL